MAYLYHGDINPMITMTKGNYESDDYEYEKKWMKINLKSVTL